MNANEQLKNYLSDYQSRIKRLLIARAAAIVACLFLVTIIIAAYWAISAGFADQTVWYGRLAILVVVGVALYMALLRPLKKLKSGLAEWVEQTSPEFDGRIQTYLSAAQDNPMRDLLAEDSLRIAEKNPPEEGINRWKMLIPSAVAGVATLALIAALTSAPGLMNYSLRHLLAGWMVPDLLPPQSIAVNPGDELVRRGASLRIQADTSGYQPSEASLYVRMETGDWQEVSMTMLLDSESESSSVERSFDFTLFSVRESLSYYVESEGIRSPNYSVEVIDLPGIKNLEVTYIHPEWTGLEPETFEQGGDIDALPGTGVRVKVTTDMPLPAGELVLNAEALDMEISGESAEAGFTVETDGEYFLAARVGAEQVRLSDTFFIRVLEDEKPEIEFASPGRDRNATSIEEVATTIQVEDDYRLENVELRYAVNGGEWQSVSLPPESRQTTLDHTFYLEEITTDSLVEIAEGEEANVGAEAAVVPTELVPGDLISYYAVAEDRASQAQTDIYFIEVQPFDRRVSTAEQGGGAGQGGQGADEQEISQRQKEIIISTWNLIREQSEQSRDAGDDLLENRIRDNAILLSSLQSSLQEQAQSLLETAESREIDGDERVATFIGHMERAILAMTPASERLAEIDLETAIQPEQEALQHLLRADAVFNDIQLSLNRDPAAAAGGGGAQDLAEVMDLEIDFEQNQYETGSQASRESLEQQTEDAMDELAELARRQEQLANNVSRTQTPTEAQQWQQELLRRDAEELRERLDQLQRAQNPQGGQQAGQQSEQQGQGEQQGQAGEAGQQAGTGETGQQQESSSSEAGSELDRRLESALDAMERASEAMRTGDTDQLQQAAGEARRQLEGAESQIAEDQETGLQESFADMASRAEQLHREQSRMEETLLDGVQRAISSAPEGATTIINPFEWEEEQQLAEQKREMIAELQRLKEDMQVNADRVRSDVPRVSRIIDQADQDLKDSEISTRMDIAANYMARGESLYIANSESLVTRSLEELSDTLDEAARAFAGGQNEESTLDRLLSGLREGGEALRDLSQGGAEESSNEQQAGELAESQPGQEQESQQAGGAGEQPGQQGETPQGGQQPGQQAGQGQQPGQEQQAGQGQQEGQGQQPGQGQGQQAGQGQGQQNGQPGGGNVNWGGWDRAPNDAIGDVETQLDALRAEIGNLVPELRARGVGQAQIDEVNQLVRELQNAGLSNEIDNLLELNETLALLEQLQQSVETSLSSESGRVRSESPGDIQLEYKEAVAEYYRRLSDDSEQGSSEFR